MKKMYILFLSLVLSSTAFAQPDQWAVAIDPTKVEEILSVRREIDVVQASTSIIVDGEKDDMWDKVTPTSYDRFIKYHTAYTNGVYEIVSDLKSERPEAENRLPSSTDDFSGSYRVLYDEDYIYCFFDITDDEVNDGVLNPGTQDELEFQEAPYPDSAQDVLKGSPYPPYSGPAGEMNKKFCYWGYLGAFKMQFQLSADGKCNIAFREKADALAKINYEQRAASCQCAWKPKTSGSNGYTAEVAISLKIALADSSNVPYTLPPFGEFKKVAFEMKVIDKDFGAQGRVQASWNAENNNVWDAMLWAGRLMIKGWKIDNENINEPKISFGPNPSTDYIKLTEQAQTIEIISITGSSVKSVQNTNQVDVSEIAPGMYIVKINGLLSGKLLKQ